MARRRPVAAEIGTAGRLLLDHFDRFSATATSSYPSCASVASSRLSAIVELHRRSADLVTSGVLTSVGVRLSRSTAQFDGRVLTNLPARKRHHGVVLDPAQGELGDTALQRAAREVRPGRVRRKDFYLPAAQVMNETAQVQPDFYVLCRCLVIVVEQVKYESPTVKFPS